MFKLTRKERRGDRTRSRITTPSEAVTPVYENGMITVAVSKQATATTLIKRHGFAMVRDEPAVTRAKPAKPAPPPIATPKPATPEPAPEPRLEKSRAKELAEMPNTVLRVVARDLRVPGRSSLGRDELIAAILNAEA